MIINVLKQTNGGPWTYAGSSLSWAEAKALRKKLERDHKRRHPEENVDFRLEEEE